VAIDVRFGWPDLVVAPIADRHHGPRPASAMPAAADWESWRTPEATARVARRQAYGRWQLVTRLLFVYGTLKPGRSRWPLLAPFIDSDEPARESSVAGQLWDTPYGWPAMTAGPAETESAARTPGVVVALAASSLEDALIVLDDVEGAATTEARVGGVLFTRELVVLSDGAAAWAYLWPGSTDGFTPVDGPW
jgi:gamma-glutamylcyclotransferase (GGCT)/AIG2-like uncharacterized protein YtfP